MAKAKKIPTLDLASGSFRKNVRIFGEGLEKFGFVNVVNFGIDKAVLRRVYKMAERTFDLPLETKQRYESVADGRFTGYASPKVEHAKDSDVGDLKEFWHVRKNVAPELRRFPKEIPEFGAVCFDLCDRLDEVANHLLLLLESYLGKPAGTLTGMIRGGDSLLRLLNYWELLGGEDGVRSAEHTDINIVTLLLSATASGLEVQNRDGKWMPIDNPPDSLIANSGDMLEAYTGGQVRSTPHRVVNGNGKRRLSIPYFIHPRAEVVLVEDPRLTAGEYLQQRLREIGLIS